MKSFREVVGESLGRASVAWTESPSGVFDSEVCQKLCDKIVEEHESQLSVANEKLKVLMDGIMQAKLNMRKSAMAYRNLEDCLATVDEMDKEKV